MFWRGRKIDDFTSEIDAHLQHEIARLREQGMTADDARTVARRQFGNVTRARERFYESHRWLWLDHFVQDVRYGIRMLRKSPAFTAIAVLTLALGIGVNASIFGLVDSTLANSIPFQQPERLVYVWTIDSTGEMHTPLPPQYRAVSKYQNAFQQVAGLGWVDDFYGSDDSGWQNLPGLVVTTNWLATLGVKPLLGRDFRSDEQILGNDAVVMLSYNSWHSRFHADPRIIGKQITLNRRPVTIIGVLPQSLGPYYRNVEFFAPMVLQLYEASGNLRSGSVRVQIFARMKPGLTLDQAGADVEAIANGLRGSAPAPDRRGRLVVEDFLQEFQQTGPTARNARRGLLMMAFAAAVVLLIACANVASLLLARVLKRNREFTLRSALGCSRRRMIRQLLTESLLLFLCGGFAGLIAARWSQEIISKVASGIVSNVAVLEVNTRVLAAGLAVSLFTALGFGLIPALHASRVNVIEYLKDSPARVSSALRSRRARNSLVVFQIALGMALIVCFGLLFRSLLHVEKSPLGFESSNILTETVTLSHYLEPSYRASLMQNALDRVRSLPGVESAGIADSLPMEGAESDAIRIDGTSTQKPGVEREIWFVSVSPDYFSTLKVPMLAGRPFSSADSANAPRVAVVNRAFWSAYFPGDNPIGRHVAFASSPGASIEIVGVVSDFRQRNPEEDLRPLLYFPIAQLFARQSWSMAIRVRAARDVGALQQSVGASLRSLDPGLYWQSATLKQHIHDSESLTFRRPVIFLLGSIGSLALVLVLVGVFGVTSYTVAERTREIGIRVALGAARLNVAALVFREALLVALTGLAIGAAGAFALASFFPTSGIGWSGSGIFLYNVSRTDALTYLAAAALLIGVSVFASWIPARRAMRVDPMIALRHE